MVGASTWCWCSARPRGRGRKIFGPAYRGATVFLLWLDEALRGETRCIFAAGVIHFEKVVKMRPEHDARRAIIREWMSLPRDKRQTEEQAAAFAIKAIEKHEFRCSGDRQQRGHGLATTPHRQVLVHRLTLIPYFPLLRNGPSRFSALSPSTSSMSLSRVVGPVSLSAEQSQRACERGPNSPEHRDADCGPGQDGCSIDNAATDAERSCWN